MQRNCNVVSDRCVRKRRGRKKSPKPLWSRLCKWAVLDLNGRPPRCQCKDVVLEMYCGSKTFANSVRNKPRPKRLQVAISFHRRCIHRVPCCVRFVSDFDASTAGARVFVVVSERRWLTFNPMCGHDADFERCTRQGSVERCPIEGSTVTWKRLFNNSSEPLGFWRRARNDHSRIPIRLLDSPNRGHQTSELGCWDIQSPIWPF